MMASTLSVGTIKLEDPGAVIVKCETGDNTEGRRQMPFDCSKEIGQYKCKKCPSFRTSFLASLKHHVCNGHLKENDVAHLYKCFKCLFLTHSKYLMGRHSYFSECATRDENERKKRFVQCQPSQSDLTQLKKKRKRARKPARWFTCDQCTYRSKKKQNVVRHFKVRHTHSKSKDIQWLKCDQCPYICKHKGSLSKHMEVNHYKPEDIQWFKCDQCPYKYTYKRGLTIHMKLAHSKS